MAGRRPGGDGDDATVAPVVPAVPVAIPIPIPTPTPAGIGASPGPFAAAMLETVSVDPALSLLFRKVQNYLNKRKKQDHLPYQDYLDRQEDWGKILRNLIRERPGALASEIKPKRWPHSNEYLNAVTEVFTRVAQISPASVQGTANVFIASLGTRYNAAESDTLQNIEYANLPNRAP